MFHYILVTASAWFNTTSLGAEETPSKLGKLLGYDTLWGNKTGTSQKSQRAVEKKSCGVFTVMNWYAQNVHKIEHWQPFNLEQDVLPKMNNTNGKVTAYGNIESSRQPSPIDSIGMQLFAVSVHSV